MKDVSSLFIFEDVIWAKYGIQERFRQQAVTREHYFWRAEMPISETSFWDKTFLLKNVVKMLAG